MSEILVSSRENQKKTKKIKSWNARENNWGIDFRNVAADIFCVLPLVNNSNHADTLPAS